MADAAIWMVQQAAISLALRPLSQEERGYLERRALPQPMYTGVNMVLGCARACMFHMCVHAQ